MGEQMKKGTIVERKYSVTNMAQYKKSDFLKKLDKISANEGITILDREINEAKKSVRIVARFDSDNWDVCGSLDFLSKHGIQVAPTSDFVVISEENCDEVKITIKKMREVLSA